MTALSRISKDFGTFHLGRKPQSQYRVRLPVPFCEADQVVESVIFISPFLSMSHF
jgi:hypothetical protein